MIFMLYKIILEVPLMLCTVKFDGLPSYPNHFIIMASMLLTKVGMSLMVGNTV